MGERTWGGSLGPASRLRSWATEHSVLLACVATLVLHLLFLTRVLGSDEGGFAMVARYWREEGPYLYGPQWVDRPPGLLVVFEAAGALGPYGVRLTAGLLAVVMVAVVAWAAEAVGGAPAARWSAWATFALASSVLLEAEALNGELAAATLVALGVAALLRAVRAGSAAARLGLGALSGAAATSAFLVKQNFVDVFVFAGVLLGLSLLTRENRAATPPRVVAVVIAGFVTGALVPATVTLVWAARRGRVDELGYAVFGFRADAAAVMADWSWAAPLARLQVFVVIGLVSGVFLLLVHLVRHHHHRLWRIAPLPWAITLTVAWEIIAIAVGANFWRHYLLALVPLLALTTGLAVEHRRPRPRVTRTLIVLAAVVTVVAAPVELVRPAGTAVQAYVTGRWLGEAARPHDTVVVPFTHANVIEASGLRPGYPYSWSLPVRTLDPDLSLLVGTLRGPEAPTWVVRWDAADSWGLDPDGRVDAALRDGYRMVGEVCGHPVWLRVSASRELPSLPTPAACRADG